MLRLNYLIGLRFMYGCNISFTKRKYTKNGNYRHCLDPYTILERYGYDKQLETFLCDSPKRNFIPKNCVWNINIEWHKWADVHNPYKDIELTKDEYEAILHQKVHPLSDCKYGVYLDDGWINIYRSTYIIGRFKIKKTKSNAYCIVSTQLSGERTWGDFCAAVSDYMCACRIVSVAAANVFDFGVLCKYYNGEEYCPKKWKGTIEANFWYGEKMFITSGANIYEWAKLAKKVRSKLKGKKLKQVSNYVERELGVLLYIKELYSKLNPNDDLEWVYEY